jgi:hypothetical protein
VQNLPLNLVETSRRRLCISQMQFRQLVGSSGVAREVKHHPTGRKEPAHALLRSPAP